jgi:competence protein ComFA
MSGCHKYSIYIAANSDSRRCFAGYTHDPILDASFLREQGYPLFYLLTLPLSAGQVFPLFEKIGNPLDFRNIFLDEPLEKFLVKAAKRLKSGARQLRIPRTYICPHPLESLQSRPFPGEDQTRALEEALCGRILFLSEIERLLGEQGIRLFGETEDVLQLLCLENRCLRLPGIKQSGRNTFMCSRCGQKEGIAPIDCASCGERCYHCEICLSMGECRFCQPLFAVPLRFPRIVDKPQETKFGETSNRKTKTQESIISVIKTQEAKGKVIRPKISFSLSPAQAKASDSLQQFVGDSKSNEILVWAACGAGKTEVTFNAIAQALNNNQKVLFAIPRKDAVEELFTRFRRTFPDVPMACLHGSRKEKFLEASLVLATTHQVIRFYSCFDLVILDEIDAYPYSISPMLEAGIRRAKTDSGKIIFMTATPSKQMRARYEKGELACLWIPARYHGFPLPVPNIVLERQLPVLELGNTVPESIIRIIHETLEGDLAQLMVFVPSIEKGFRVTRALEVALRLPPFNNFQGEWVKFCHSRDGKRGETLMDFRKGKFPVLVTTTVSERGLTIPRVNVLVLFADASRIFDSSALIQMSGRSGRTMDYPRGKVWYAGVRCSKEMQIACKSIERLNQQAKDMGFLHYGSLQYDAKEMR